MPCYFYKKINMKIAQMLVETLVEAGVERIHGIVGDSANAIAYEIKKNGKIRWVSYRNEEAAAFAAGAEAQLTGKLAVCIASCGPGSIHLMQGLYDSHRSYAPVLAIATHIPSGEIGTTYFQETDPKSLFKGCSHYCEQITSGAQMPRVLQTAMQHAVSRKGVAVVVLSGDVSEQEVLLPKLRHNLLLQQPVIRPSDRELEMLADLINEHEKITLFCGNGCEEAHDEVMALCEKIKSPVVVTLRGKQFMEYDNPYFVGLTALIGYRSGYTAMAKCEVLIMLGTDFPYKDWFPHDAKIVQIDLRAENLGRRANIHTGLVGDVKETISVLTPLVNQKKNDKHLKAILKDYRNIREDLDKKAASDRSSTVLYPEYLAAEINRKMAHDAILTADVGTPCIWSARYVEMTKGRRLLGSFNHGSMANAMPQAIGAQVAFPDRQVVAFAGDGGFTMLMGELLTIRHHKLPIKLFIFNNGRLEFVALEKMVEGFPIDGVELDNPDFARMAEAIGIKAFTLRDPADVQSVVAEALAYDGPVVIDAYVNPTELSMPPKVDLQEAKGFTLWAIRETFDGQIGEVLNTIKTNFLT
jgi:thiamine pyrophosphate-dependent acetolactate synthase large subunit-like protein